MNEPNSSLLRGCAALSVTLAMFVPATASAERDSSRLDSHAEIFRWADRDGNNNLSAIERDLLRAAFPGRPDFRILDLNRNQELDREEIDYLEKGRVKKKKKDKNKKNKR